MRIVAISRVKNEADIIEPFVRHTLAFADSIVLMDHASTDRTPEILRALQEEGLPLHVIHDSLAGQIQIEHMNRLLQLAVHDFNADWVLCLDADEFIDTPSIEEFRTQFDHADSSALKMVTRTYYAQPEDPAEELNPVVRISHRLVQECWPTKDEVLYKVMVPAALVRKTPGRLNQGNHAFLIDGMPSQEAIMPNVHLAHFSLRSPAQYAIKLVNFQLQKLRRVSTTGDEMSFYNKPYETLRKSYTEFVSQFYTASLPYARKGADRTIVRDPMHYRGGPLRYVQPQPEVDKLIEQVLGLAEHLAPLEQESADTISIPEMSRLPLTIEAVSRPMAGHKKVSYFQGQTGRFEEVVLSVDCPSDAQEMSLKLNGGPGVLEIREMTFHFAHGIPSHSFSNANEIDASLRIEEGGAAIWSPTNYRVLVSKFPLVMSLTDWKRNPEASLIQLRLSLRFDFQFKAAVYIRSEVLNEINRNKTASAEVNILKAALQEELLKEKNVPAPDFSELEACKRKLARMTYPLGSVIHFSINGNSLLYTGTGWSHEEDWGTWTDGEQAVLRLPLDRLPRRALRLSARVRPFLTPAHSHLRVHVELAGKKVGTLEFDRSDPQDISVRFPREQLIDRHLEIVFHIVNPVSPLEQGTSIDGRALGLGFESLQLTECR